MEEFVTHFGIDAKLLLAQIINFSVVLIILRKFAYKPILKMLHDRKVAIEQGIEMRSQAEKNLRESDEMRNRTLQKANVDALAIVTQAEQLGKTRQDEMVKETDKKVEGIITDARRVIDREKSKMNSEVTRDAQDLIRLSIEKVLGKLPSKDRDTVLIQEALKELRSVK